MNMIKRSYLLIIVIISFCFSYSFAASSGTLIVSTPVGVTLELKEGFESNSSQKKISESNLTKTTTEITYKYENLPYGNYRFVVKGKGYYSITNRFYFTSSNDNQKVYVDPGKRAGNGYESSSSLQIFTDEMLNSAFPSSKNLWPNYSKIFSTPAFNSNKAKHEYTSHQEIMSFIN